MKLLTIVFLLSLHFTGICEAEPDTHAQAINNDLAAFVDQFNKAVNAHDDKAIFRLLEKKYRKKQLKFLKGNKEQLINELFGGSNEAGVWRNSKLEEITYCWMYDQELMEDGNYRIWLEVELENNIVSVELIVQTNTKFKKWGIVGAQG